MPKRYTYRLQGLPRRGASWRTLGKWFEERTAIFEGDALAPTTTDWELRVIRGAEVIEHWLLRDKPAPKESAHA